MNNKSLILKMIFGFTLFTVIVYFLYAVVGIPTPKRINMTMMGYGLGSVGALTLVMLFPRFRHLCLIIMIPWLIAFIMGALSLLVIIYSGIMLQSFSSASLQLLAFYMAMGIIGIAVSLPLYICFEDADEAYKAEKREAKYKTQKAAADKVPASA